jgi:glutathione peroxidase
MVMRSITHCLKAGVLILVAFSFVGAGQSQSRAEESNSGIKGPSADQSAGREKKVSPSTQPAARSVYAFKLKDIDGKEKTLRAYKGKTLLIVNVASKCGYTKQYKGLEALYEKYKDKGLVIVGFPSNDFGGQEPGTEQEIKQFCSKNYNVTFPMMSKSSVKNGEDQSPLYQYLSKKTKNGVLDAKVGWNFNKFLVSRDGHVIKHYDSKVTPESEDLAKDIEAALKG